MEKEGSLHLRIVRGCLCGLPRRIKEEAPTTTSTIAAAHSMLKAMDGSLGSRTAARGAFAMMPPHWPAPSRRTEQDVVWYESRLPGATPSATRPRWRSSIFAIGVSKTARNRACAGRRLADIPRFKQRSDRICAQSPAYRHELGRERPTRAPAYSYAKAFPTGVRFRHWIILSSPSRPFDTLAPLCQKKNEAEPRHTTPKTN